MKTNRSLSLSLYQMLMRIAKLQGFWLILVVLYNGLPITSSSMHSGNTTVSSTTYTNSLRSRQQQQQDNVLVSRQQQQQQNESISIFEDHRLLQVTTTPTISRIEVIDALNDRIIITDLVQNAVINLQAYGLDSPISLSFNAVPVIASAVGSVVLRLDTNVITRTESSAPYTLCGEMGPDYFRCLKFTTLGTHVIGTTPYSGSSATGIVGPDFSRVFSVVLSGTAPVVAPPPPITAPVTAPITAPVTAPITAPVTAPVKAPITAPVTAPVKAPVTAPVTAPIVVPSPVQAPVPTSSTSSSVSVYSTKTNSAILTLTAGQIIYLGNYGLTSPSQLNFVANVNTLLYASAVLDLDNKLFLRMESLAPFSLCGDTDDGSIFLSCKGLKLGVHTLLVTPYTASGGKGTAGPIITLSFTIASGTSGGGGPTPPAPVVVSPPVAPPVTSPVASPVALPTPTSTSSCTLPKFVGSWEATKPYPLPLSEGQGALFGNDFVLISGFSVGFKTVTTKVFALDVTNPIANWREMTPIPLSVGLTHGAFARVGTHKLYICGGYVGAHPGPATNLCFLYDHEKTIGTQWSTFPSLPAQRAGGALWYDKTRHSLTFTAGASRPDPNRRIYTIDHSDTWEIRLNTLGNGWVSRATAPYKGNHVGFTTVLHDGVERHYIAGGQLGEDEHHSNLDDVIEWKPSQNQFIRRENLLEPRGHFSSSTVPYKNCGFLIAAGAINDSERTDEVTYYDIEKDEWSVIGKIPGVLTTPVCVITNDNYFRCETGYVNQGFSWRIRIE